MGRSVTVLIINDYQICCREIKRRNRELRNFGFRRQRLGRGGYEDVVESRDTEGRKRKEIEGVEKKAWLGEPSTDAMGRWGRKEEDREHPPPALERNGKNGSR